jgi:hypothetical protein
MEKTKQTESFFPVSSVRFYSKIFGHRTYSTNSSISSPQSLTADRPRELGSNGDIPPAQAPGFLNGSHAGDNLLNQR